MNALLVLAAAPAWFVTFATARPSLTCHGSVIRTSPTEFAVATASHCVGNIHSITTAAHSALKLQGGEGSFVTSLSSQDYAVVFVPAPPRKIEAQKIGKGPPKWLVVTRKDVPVELEVHPSVLAEMGEFNRRCEGDSWCQQCAGRATLSASGQSVVETDSGAAVLKASKELIGVISTKSYGGVASYCEASLPRCGFDRCEMGEDEKYAGPQILLQIGKTGRNRSREPRRRARPGQRFAPPPAG
ncbi:MAG: hypothetical protein K1Y01_12985 [Vicinamibacteria bacterium]|nr:hypothetical protein [Vicinamibacteria bacterium]